MAAEMRKELRNSVNEINKRTILEVTDGPDKLRLKKAYDAWFDENVGRKPTVEFKVVPQLLDDNGLTMAFKDVRPLTLRVCVPQLGCLSRDDFNVWGYISSDITSTKGNFIYDGSLLRKDVLVYMHFNTNTKTGTIYKVKINQKWFELSLMPGPLTAGYEIEHQLECYGYLLPSRPGNAADDVFNIDIWLNEQYGMSMAYALRNGEIDVYGREFEDELEALNESASHGLPEGFEPISAYAHSDEALGQFLAGADADSGEVAEEAEVDSGLELKPSSDSGPNPDSDSESALTEDEVAEAVRNTDGFGSDEDDEEGDDEDIIEDLEGDDSGADEAEETAEESGAVKDAKAGGRVEAAEAKPVNENGISTRFGSGASKK